MSSAKETLSAKREDGARRLLMLYTQRRRLSSTLDRLNADIAAHERDLDLVDGILGIIT